MNLNQARNRNSSSSSFSNSDKDRDDDQGSLGGGTKWVRLTRQITLVDCISIAVGQMIGSGIFISPRGVLVYTGSTGWALIVWLLCGVFTMIGALCFAELGTTFKVSGGDYTYILYALGPVPAFLRLWTRMAATRTGSRAINSIAFAYYVLLPVYVGCQVPFVVSRFIGAALLILIAVINCVSVPLTRKIQVITTVLKVVGLIAIIVAGIYQLALGNTSNIDNVFSEGSISWKTLPLAFYSGLYAYSGWQYLPSVSEEIINPSRTLPLSIVLSTLIVTVIYLLTNIAYFTLLNFNEVLSSNAVALDFGQRVFGDWAWVLSVVVAISIAGNLNSGAITFARTFLTASREGQVPEIVSMVHIDRRTPFPAVIGLVPISIILMLGGDVSSLINYVSFVGWLFVAVACAIIPYYRWKHPEMERPFKVPLVIPIVFVFCALFLVGMSLYSNPVDCGIGLAITLAGVPVYYLGVAWKTKPKCFTNGLDRLTIFLQQLLLVVPQEELPGHDAEGEGEGQTEQET